jgi:phenylalanyl-tRNA synthetase beta chain
MNTSLNWLTDYLDVGAVPAAELDDVLTRIGLCCEGFEETDADVVLDVEVTSNRPDCLGHVGVARELAAAMGLELTVPDVSAVPQAGPPASELTAVEVLDWDLCPRYTARVIRGVKVGPSPAWMAERLEAVGLRSVNNVVDATNYVMMECGQPLHAFDHDKLAEGRIVVRRGRDGEEMVSIDGTRCRLNDRMCVIADAERPVAIAGIMGGLDSEVGEGTANLLIESAAFDPKTTRQTARALRLMSEASYRFERGVDPAGQDWASLRACRLILDLAGGELAPGLVDAWAEPVAAGEVALRPERTRKLLGVDLSEDAQAELLGRLGLEPKLDAGRIVCTVPTYRGDLTREVDLIEEVARLHGLDNIPVHGRVTHAVRPMDTEEVARRRLREVLAAAGFDEAVTFSFHDDEELALLGFEGGVRVDPSVRRSNNLLRPGLIGSLLRAAKNNQDAGNAGVSLYELAAVFPPGSKAGGLPDEYIGLGLVTARELRELRGTLEAAADRLAGDVPLELIPADHAGLAEGAAATVRLGGVDAGVIGMVDAPLLDHYGLERPHAAANIRFGELLRHAGRTPTYQPLPKFPAVRRDLSVVVDEATTWAEVAEAVASVTQPRREDVEYVGQFRGKQVGRGRKSVTFTLVYRSPEGTLRGEEVDEMVGEVVAALGESLGGELRT